MINKKLLILGFMIVILGFLMQYSSLHNVDLSWNAKHIDMVDDNGIIVQDLVSMYQRSLIMLWVAPLIIVMGMVIMYSAIKNDKVSYSGC